jgi:Asp/Glu/Hydantoin racemase
MRTTPIKKTYYGVSLGILMLETYFQRFNGDIGNARTWPFPVQYRIVKGASPDRITNLTTTDFLQPFLDAADDLIAGGCDGITTTCGFLALYQRELTEHCAVPVATSALLQVPMVARILPKAKRPAIITFSAESLTTRHLTSVGVDSATPVIGMSPSSEFQRSIRTGDTSVSIDTLRAEVLDVASRALRDDPTIGALVLECTNLTPYSADLRRTLSLPIFDVVSLIHWFHRSLRPEVFSQD